MSRNRGSKLAETAIVTEIEHFWHLQKEKVMIEESLRRLIPFSLADKEKLKVWKAIDAQ